MTHLEKYINKYEIKPIKMDDNLKQNSDAPDHLPNKAKLKVNVRNIQKVKKQLYKSQDVVEYRNKLGVIKSWNNKKYKIDKIKRPRKYVIAEQNVFEHYSKIDNLSDDM